MSRILLLLALLCSAASARQKGAPFDPAATATTNASFQRQTLGERIPADWLRPSPSGYRLGPSDKIDIELFGGNAARETVTVCPDGRIYFDLLPGTLVAGLTVEQTRTLLEEKLRQFYREPRIAVTLQTASSQRVSILGRVNKPGLLPLTHPTTLVDAISQAGGLFVSGFSGTTEELADLDHSFILRAGRMLPVSFARLLRDGDMRHNIYLQPGDYIYLPSTLNKQVHIIGAVKQPRAVGFAPEMSLASAIGAALGPLPSADLSHVVIVRGSLTEPTMAVVDFTAVQKGRAPNVRLEPRDIVYVPESRWQGAAKWLNLVVNTFTRTVAANEGIHAAGGSSGSVTPSITIGQ